MMNKYENLDTAILQRVQVMPLPTFTDFYALPSVKAEAQRIALEAQRDPARVVDGRLKSLRNAGKIEWNGRRWELKA